jgi:hypothetical protein
MLSAMTSTLRIMRSFNLRDSAERIRAMRQHADQDPGGFIAPWMAAIAFWEEGEIEEAHRWAEAILVEQPFDFRMLVICLDWSIRAGDAGRTLAFAQRVVQAENPSRRLRRTSAVTSVLLWPLRLLGRGGSLRQEAETLDKWAQWAKEYVESSAQKSHAP